MSPTAQLRRLPVPESEPPYDDESEDLPPDRLHPKDGLQGTLALSYDLPNGLPAEPERPVPLRLAKPPGTRRHDRDPRGGRGGETRVWANRIASAVVEVLAGERPAAQLLRWTTQEVYDMVARRARRTGRKAGLAGSGRATPTIRYIRLCEPADGVVEASAVVARDERFSAVALRLESADGRWRCTALEMSWPPGGAAARLVREAGFGEKT